MDAPTPLERARALAEPWPPQGESCRRSGMCIRYAGHEGACVPALHRSDDLAAFALAFAEALPGLYLASHDASDAGYCEARARDLDAPFQPPTPEVCTCGVDDHNARLDALADKLGIPSEERRKP